MAFRPPRKDQPARQCYQHRGQQTHQQDIYKDLAQRRDLGPAAGDGEQTPVKRVRQGQIDPSIFSPRRAQRHDVIAFVIARNRAVAIDAPIGTDVAEDQAVGISLSRFRFHQTGHRARARGGAEARHVLRQIGSDRLLERSLCHGIAGRKTEQADSGKEQHQQQSQPQRH